MPVTSVAETLLDYASGASLPRVRQALAEAEYRGLLSTDAVVAVLGHGRPGSARLRVALRRHLPELARTRSPLEQAFLALCESSGVSMPEVNARVGQMTVDALWRSAGVVVELDGHRSHGTRARIERDRRRELWLRAAGYSVVRYTAEQLTEQRELIRADLERLLS